MKKTITVNNTIFVVDSIEFTEKGNMQALVYRLSSPEEECSVCIDVISEGQIKWELKQQGFSLEETEELTAVDYFTIFKEYIIIAVAQQYHFAPVRNDKPIVLLAIYIAVIFCHLGFIVLMWRGLFLWAVLGYVFTMLTCCFTARKFKLY